VALRDLIRLRRPDPSSLGPPTHLPVPTMDPKDMMAAFKKALGDAPASSMFGGGWQGALSTRYRTGESRLNALRNSYGGTQDSVTWAFACISLIASTLASYPKRITDLEGETIENPPADLAGLLDRPNQGSTWFDLIETVATELELLGNSYVLKNEMNGMGQPKSLYRLRPDRVRIALARDGTVMGYVYSPDGQLMIPYDVDEVIHFKYPNPLDPHYGMGTVEAIAPALDQHSAQGLHVTGYFQNGARISGVLTIPETLSDAQFERLKQSWQENYAGPANAFKLLIAEGAADYKAISQTPIASGVVDLMKITKDEILSGFGVPAPLLGGILENANYKMDESQHIFLRAMTPKARRVAERLTVDLGRLWGVEVAIDPHADEPMDVKLEHAKLMMGAGFTVNEIRESVGEPRSDDPRADKILVPADVIPLDIAGLPPRPGRSIPMEDNSEPGAPPALPSAEQAGAARGEQPTEHPSLADRLADLPDAIRAPKAVGPAAQLAEVERELEAMRKELEALPERRAADRRPKSALEAAAELSRAWGAGDAAKAASGDEGAPGPPEWEPPSFPRGYEALSAKAARSAEARAVREHQAQVLRLGVDTFEPMARRFFAAQRDRVLQAMAQFGPKRAKAKQELSAEAIFDLVAENEALQAAYLPALDEVGKAALPMPMELGGGISWDVTSPAIASLRKGLGEKITRVNQTTKDAISEQVAEGLRRGYSVTQIANGRPEEKYGGVQGVFSDATDYRAEMIARTEAAFAYNGAQVADYGAAGVSYVEILDGQGDAECADADGSVWTLDDYDANPIAHPNCSRSAIPSDNADAATSPDE
jgi:HK97 family phage portal protein